MKSAQTIFTWQDGTQKSVGNAFDWLTKPEPKAPAKPMTTEEKARAYQRNYWHTKAKNKATRVNSFSDIGRSTDNDKAHALKRGNSAIGTEKTKPATGTNCAGF